MAQLEYLQRKITTAEELLTDIARWRVKGHHVVFTNGVFDLLHRGHVTLLAKAADLGNYLIVGLNSDASVRTLGKGPDRPINAENDRAYVLAGLSSVARVVIFSEPTPIELIRAIKPDTLVKGGDYDPAELDPNSRRYIVGSEFQRAQVKKTVSIPLVDGYSTTATSEKLKNG